MTVTGDNIVRIGKKPSMNYISACVTLFNTGNDQIVVRARGKAITKAVDIVEMLRRSFIKKLKVKSINVDSDELMIYGKNVTISIIEIFLER
ncbi:MAG: DNA-binding protein Alba [Candidatus Bathyarchaeota archaeon]|nr:DNA-binding protein Alba [Candidatus Bathyarchaeota archaeon]